MSEATIQSGIQGVLQGLATFANADVVINDWTILDQADNNAPYVIIEPSDDFVSTQMTKTGNTSWNIPLNLFVRFVDWATSMTAFTTARDAVIAGFNAVGTARSAGGIDAVDIQTIRTDGPIDYLYDAYVQNPEEAEPIFIFQRLIAEVEEGWG